MSSLSPDILWKRFTTDIADPPADTAPNPGESFEEVMTRIRDLAVRLPPHALRVIDPVLYERGRRALSEGDLLDFARELGGEADIELSLDHARDMVSEQFAVLDPINLLSFPYPEIRSILVGRFGANSAAGRLHDLFDFESNEEVRGVIIEALHARLHWKEINPRERHEIFSFAKEVLVQGYELGNSIIAARAAYYLLAELSPTDLPKALRQIHTDFDDISLETLRGRDRIGVIRIVGSRLQSKSLLDLVAREQHPIALEELLHECHHRWGAGFMPLENSSVLEEQRASWRFIGDVMIRRLGFSDMPRESLRIALQADSGPEEPRWRTLLRRLALVALDEGSGPELP